MIIEKPQLSVEQSDYSKDETTMLYRDLDGSQKIIKGSSESVRAFRKENGIYIDDIYLLEEPHGVMEFYVPPRRLN